MIRNQHPGPDHHQKLITSRGSTLARAIPCLVDVRYLDCELSCSQYTTNRQTDRQTQNEESQYFASLDRLPTTSGRGFPVILNDVSPLIQFLNLPGMFARPTRALRSTNMLPTLMLTGSILVLFAVNFCFVPCGGQRRLADSFLTARKIYRIVSYHIGVFA